MSKFQVVSHRRLGIGQVTGFLDGNPIVRFARGTVVCFESELNIVRAS